MPPQNDYISWRIFDISGTLLFVHQIIVLTCPRILFLLQTRTLDTLIIDHIFIALKKDFFFLYYLINYHKGFFYHTNYIHCRISSDIKLIKLCMVFKCPTILQLESFVTHYVQLCGTESTLRITNMIK